MNLLVIICLIKLFRGASHSAWYETETKLKETLSKNYDIDVIPIVKNSDALNVSVGLGLFSIDHFRIESNILKGSFFFALSWNDARLRWTPSDYDGLAKTFSFKHQDIWTPDVVLFYGDQVLAYDIAKGPYTVVTNNGDVLFVPPTKITMKCHKHINETETLAAINSQELIRWCSFTFGSWVYDTSKLQLELMGKDNKIDISSYIPDPKIGWEIVENFASVGTKYYPCCPDYPYMYTKFTIKLKKSFH